jgi:hypothetical protein
MAGDAKTINWNRFYYSVNTHFFKRWSPQMAYILGFMCSDGNVHKTTVSWDLSDIHPSNMVLLKNINRAMSSNYPIVKQKHSYRLRISNPIIVQDLLALGVTHNKSKTIKLPNVPQKYFQHFIRGVLDGDGWISIRVRLRHTEFSVGFVCGSYEFMKELSAKLNEGLSIGEGNLREKRKITKRGFISRYYMMEYHSDKAYKLLSYIYRKVNINDLYLIRKYLTYQKVLKIHADNQKSRKIPRLWRMMRSDNLHEYLNQKIKFKTPPAIARELKVSKSSIYRWLQRTGFRKSTKAGSRKWSNKIRSR